MRIGRLSALCSLLLSLGVLAACTGQAASSVPSSAAPAPSVSTAPASSASPQEQQLDQLMEDMERLAALEDARDEVLDGHVLRYNEHLLFEYEGSIVECSGSNTPIRTWEELTSFYPAWGLPQTFDGYTFSVAAIMAGDNLTMGPYIQGDSPMPPLNEVFAVTLDLSEIRLARLTYTGQAGAFSLIVFDPASYSSTAVSDPVEALADGYAMVTSTLFPDLEGTALHWSDDAFGYLLYGPTDEAMRSWAEQDVREEFQLIQEV